MECSLLTDVNECAIKSDKSPVCGPTIAGDCKNIKGGYECSCRSGFKSLHSNKKGPCVGNRQCNPFGVSCSTLTSSFVIPPNSNTFSDWRRACHLSWVKTP